MKLCPCVALSSFFLLMASRNSCVKASGDDHDHEESCACAALEEGFGIDCSNQGAMTAALSALTTNGCDTDCSTEVCHRNFLIIQSHHDYCLASELPATLEDGIHFFEDECEVACHIAKKRDPSLPDCPVSSCEDESGNTAHGTLIANSCESECGSDLCRENFRVLKFVHDACDEDSLSVLAETNFHDLEDSCNEAHGCNIPADVDFAPNPLVCTKDPDSSSPGVTKAGMVGLVTMVVAVFAL